MCTSVQQESEIGPSSAEGLQLPDSERRPHVFDGLLSALDSAAEPSGRAPANSCRRQRLAASHLYQLEAPGPPLSCRPIFSRVDARMRPHVLLVLRRGPPSPARGTFVFSFGRWRDAFVERELEGRHLYIDLYTLRLLLAASRLVLVLCAVRRALVLLAVDRRTRARHRHAVHHNLLLIRRSSHSVSRRLVGVLTRRRLRRFDTGCNVWVPRPLVEFLLVSIRVEASAFRFRLAFCSKLTSEKRKCYLKSINFCYFIICVRACNEVSLSYTVRTCTVLYIQYIRGYGINQ